MKLGKFNNRMLCLLPCLMVAFILLLSPDVLSEPFSKVKVYESSKYVAEYTLASAIFAMVLMIAMVVFFRKNIKKVFPILDEARQVDKLVSSFGEMAAVIEGRDAKLRANIKEAIDANQAKSDFLLSISHELRTPMHAILNFAEIGKKKPDIDEKTGLYFSRIEESGERLLELINRILDLTRLESGGVELNITKHDINQCLEDCVNSLNSLVENKKIIIEKQAGLSDGFVNFDYAHISQVLVNILANAIRFTPEGKKISISVDKGYEANGDNKKEAVIYVHITNEGSHIPEKDIERIFDKFVQSSAMGPGVGGSGIGLSICKEIISLHFGKIWAENVDEGVKFSFFIPNKLPENKKPVTGVI